jgi:hypothetical protein
VGVNVEIKPSTSRLRYIVIHTTMEKQTQLYDYILTEQESENPKERGHSINLISDERVMFGSILINSLQGMNWIHLVSTELVLWRASMNMAMLLLVYL